MTMKWYGDRVDKVINDAAREALWKLGQLIIAEATNNVPFESGTLRRSGTVTVAELPEPTGVYKRAESGEEMAEAFPERPKGDLKAYVSYNTPYAAWLHESFEWEPKRAGGPKWLERAAPVVAKRLGELVRREMKKRGA